MSSPSPPCLAGLVLAAGASRRFGSPKQLALIDGVPMLQRVIETAQAALPPDESGGEPRSRITVVLGAHAEAVREGVIERLAHPRPQVVRCPNWEAGIAHSLHCGLEALTACEPPPVGPSAVLVMLGDTPYISADDLRRLIETWRADLDTPTAATYDGTVGAPCILPRIAWDNLSQLVGDQGAGYWLRRRRHSNENLRTVDITLAAYDVDTPEEGARQG